MTSSAFDPLHVHEEFWLRDDVGNALDDRDIGTLFRLLNKHTGASQTRIGTATGLSQGTVCVIMNGSRVVSAIDVLERIADGLALPDVARLRLGLAPHGGMRAWLSELLAWHAHNLRFPLTAEAYAIDCYEHANQAGHDELCACATLAMSSIALYAAQPAKAITAATRGFGKIPDHHPLAVRLRTQAARAHARQGQRVQCVELLTEAQKLHDRLPARPLKRFSVDTGIAASHAITAHPASSYI